MGPGLTWLTPPEFSVHMANLFASPTVSPSKSLPLRKERSKVRAERLDYQRGPAGCLRHKLGVVVRRPLQKVALAPQQELVQGRLRVAVNVKVVFVGPDLQAHQDHPDVEGPIQLQAEEEAVREGVGGWGGSWGREASKTCASFTLSM